MAYLPRLSIFFLLRFYAASTIAQTECSVPEFGQCGGLTYKGCLNCVEGTYCIEQDPFLWQCLGPGN
ncbi:hypothetical protein C8J57DRAFT_1331104 [Mycena rebaudengoi]|nr:hypothetical protein C8J57DRAFT_1331104 [Mycena rebaudengoi]